MKTTDSRTGFRTLKETTPLLEIAENVEAFLADIEPLQCPRCEHALYSSFDKIYINVFGHCYTCDNSTESMKDLRASNIFAILE